MVWSGLVCLLLYCVDQYCLFVVNVMYVLSVAVLCCPDCGKFRYVWHVLFCYVMLCFAV